MAAQAPQRGRRYAGQTAEERRAARHEQLVDAGLGLLAAEGPSGTSIRAVLRESGLAERYFHESFSSLDALIVAVHERIHTELMTAVRTATAGAGADVEARTRAGLRAFIETVTRDERYAQIKLQTLAGNASDELRAFRTRALAEYAELLIAFGPTEATRARGLRAEALAIAVLAAIEALLEQWVAGDLPVDVDGLLDHAVVIVSGTATHLNPTAAWPAS